MVWVIVVIAIVVLLLLIVVGMYNKLVRLRNRSENAWAQVDVQLRRRYDLIPNLIEAVKGYAAHERGTFEEVTQARTAAQQAQNMEQQAQAENVLTAALGRLFAVAEAYPQLRATENFQQLQGQLGLGPRRRRARARGDDPEGDVDSQPPVRRAADRVPAQPAQLDRRRAGTAWTGPAEDRRRRARRAALVRARPGADRRREAAHRPHDPLPAPARARPGARAHPRRLVGVRSRAQDRLRPR